jgi:bis(5'-nucleosyl)-tetraphosphatase (symmetrical)
MTLFAVGDIQGCADEFATLLETLRFEADADRLWLVGDLVNRGPASLAVLRRIVSLGDAVTTVLGNHDLHLLATAAGVRPIGDKDTFQDVLNAPDADELLGWLRHRPLLHWDREANRLLVHAGLPPGWSAKRAASEAAEIETLLRGPDWQSSLRQMYGNSPALWSEQLNEEDKRRYTINALTRMRYCDAYGRLDLVQSGAPGSQPAKLMPWFEVPGRKARDVHIVFGHWASLGLYRADNITAVDSGCVWGGSLTAVPLQPAGAPVSIPSPGYVEPATA